MVANIKIQKLYEERPKKNQSNDCQDATIERIPYKCQFPKQNVKNAETQIPDRILYAV